MKIFSKKLLSIVMAVCLLAGIAIPAGIISASGDTTMVYEIDFAAAAGTTAGEYNTYIHYYDAALNGGTYTFSFDYYLPHGTYVGIRDFAMNSSETNFVDFANGGRWSVLWLENGVHHYEKTFTGNNVNFIPGFFTHDKRGFSTIYVWNFSLVKQGTTANLFEGKSFGGGVKDYVKTVNTDVSKFGNDPIVNEVRLTDGALTWSPALYQGNAKMTPGQEIGMSFDYYVADDTTFSLELVGDSASATKEGTIIKGKGKYDATFQLKDNANGNNGVFCPKFTASGATTLYVWNMKITMGGTEKIGFIHPSSYSAAQEVYALASGAKFLSAYDWAQPEEGTVVYKYDYAAIKTAAADANTIMTNLGSRWNATANAADATIKFSYYLSGDASIVVTSANDSGTFFFRDKKTGVSSLEPGLHTFEGVREGAATGDIYPGLMLLNKEGYTNHNMDVQLYVWDMEITSNTSAKADTYTYDMTQWGGSFKNSYGGTVQKLTLDDVPTTLNNGGMYKLEYDTTGGEKDYYLAFNNAKNNYQYQLSFDYFVPAGVTAHAVAGGWTSHYNSDSGLVKDDTTGTSLLEGKGSFSATVGIKGSTLPFGVRVTAGQQATIYVWNVCITAINSTNSIRNSNMFAGAPWNSAATASFIPYDETLLVSPDTSPIVTAVDLTEKTWYPSVNAAIDSTDVNISFDYYLPNDVEVKYTNVGGFGTFTQNDKSLIKQGRGTFSVTLNLTQNTNVNALQHAFGLEQAATKIYIWNYKAVTANGTELTAEAGGNVHYAGKGDYVDGENGNHLSTFSFAEAPDNGATLGLDPHIMAIDLTNKTWYPSVNAGINDSQIDISFDYYLPNDVAIKFVNVGGFETFALGEKSLIKQGKGTFSVTMNLDKNTNVNAYQHAFGLEQAATKIYIWNYKAVTASGTELTAEAGGNVFYAGKGDYVDGENGNKLSTFAWKDEADNGAKLELGSGNGDEDVIPGDPNDPIVTEIDFSKGDTWVYEVLRNANVTTDKPFKVTFEYFLPEKATLQFDSVGGWVVMAGGSKTFKVGHHTFDASFATDLEGSGYPTPILAPKIFNEAMDAKLYIWNLSVTVDGVEQVPDNPGEADKHITAGVTENKRLTQYDWYETMDDVAGNYVDVVANKVYAFRFDQYNWEINDYSVNAIVFGRVHDIYAGMNLTLSFDYYIEGAARTHIFNPYAIWKDFELHPGANYGGHIETETNKKGHASFDFVTNENDAKHEGGTIGIGFQQQIDYGQAIMYVWNLKLTQDGGNINMLPEEFEWADNHMVRNQLVQELTIDPSTIGPGMTHPEFNNPDYVMPDTDTDDVVIEDEEDENDNDPGDVDFGNDITHILNNFSGDIRTDDASSIFISFDGELDADAYLSVYQYAAGELTDAAQAVLGDKNYLAYEILLALGTESINPDGEFIVGIPVSEGFDMSTVFVYGIDEYGDLFAVEAEYDVENNYVYVKTKVLGSFVLVDGELVLPKAPADDGAADDDAADNDAADNDKPADTKPNKNNQKDNQSNGWVLWVILGGAVVLLAAGGVVAFLVIKKKAAK